MTTYNASTTAEIKQILDEHPEGGYDIKLAGGEYDHLVIKNKEFSSDAGVRLVSADPENKATFPTALISNSSHLIFEDIAIDFIPDADTKGHTIAFTISKSDNIQVLNSVFKGRIVNEEDGFGISADTLWEDYTSGESIHGFPNGRGIRVEFSEAIDITGNDILRCP